MVAEGAKPPQPGKPSVASNGAAASGAAAGAGAGGIVGWWKQITGQASSHEAVQNVTKEVVKVTQQVKQRAQTVKWSMPVDVKVDFLRPTIETVKDSLLNVWVQLPPPVQQAAPFVGVAVGSGLVVFLVQQRRINHHRRHGDELTLQVKGLKKEKDELIKRINLLKAKSGAPRSDVEARMAAAVAEATNAAAAAADAAARAATACIIQRPPLPAN